MNTIACLFTAYVVAGLARADQKDRKYILAAFGAIVSASFLAQAIYNVLF